MRAIDRLLAAALGAACLLGACRDQSMATVLDGASCPSDLPAACPTPAPSWQASVGPLVEDRCTSCHAPGGTAAGIPLIGYADVAARRVPTLNQLVSCEMPPPEEDPLSGSQRADLLGWLVCGAPNN